MLCSDCFLDFQATLLCISILCTRHSMEFLCSDMLSVSNCILALFIVIRLLVFQNNLMVAIYENNSTACGTRKLHFNRRS